MMIAIYAAALGAIAFVVWVNVWDRRRRAAMTPAERLADDEETRREMSIW